MIRDECEVMAKEVWMKPCHSKHTVQSLFFNLRILPFRFSQCSGNKPHRFLSEERKMQLHGALSNLSGLSN